MFRLAAFALGLAVVAGCGGNSGSLTEGEGGEASGAEMSGGSSGSSANGGRSGAAGTSMGGVGNSSGASGDGGTATGAVSSGGAGAGGTDTGGLGGAQGGVGGLGGVGAQAGASGSTSAGGAAGATMTDPRCPLLKPGGSSPCWDPNLRCPYDPNGCRCLTVVGDHCFSTDPSCLTLASGTDRVAPPPAQFCVCGAPVELQVWACTALSQ